MSPIRRPIAVFYHCMFSIGAQATSSIESEAVRPPLPAGPLPAAVGIIKSQMTALAKSGLLEAADRLFIGVNGGPECFAIAAELFPPKAIVSFHGLGCRNELRTILMLERFTTEVTRFDANSDWAICYHHSKGASWPIDHNVSTPWRRCMETHVIRNWRLCMAALDEGYDAAGAHYLQPPKTPVDQRIFAGNFFWARSRFLGMLPSLLDRERLYASGIDALESRFEAEVYIGNGQKPRVMDFHPGYGSYHDCERVSPEPKEG